MGNVIMQEQSQSGADLKTETGYFLRYAVIGLFNSAADFGIFYVAVTALGLSVLLANTIAYGMVFGLSFLLNRRWAFRSVAHSDGARMQFLRFVLVNIGGLILSNMSIWLFATLLPVIVAKLVAMAVTICRCV